MRTISKGIFVGVSLLALSGCYSKYLVMQAEAVSMTKPNAESAKQLKVEGDVEEKWCMGDDPVLPSADQEYGLADQAIFKAQGKGKSADFITDARIFHDSNGCAIVTGKKAKL